jgi:hypothetical protein
LFLIWGDDYVIRLSKNEEALNMIDDEMHKVQGLHNVTEDKNAEGWIELTSQGDLR